MLFLREAHAGFGNAKALSMGRDSDLSRGMTSGAAWLVFQRLSVRTIGLLSTVILARLLTPADFGIVALATMLAAVIEAFFEFGFDLTLIQRRPSDRSLYDAAWTLSVTRGVLAGILLLTIARPATILYGDPRLFTIMAWLSAVVVAGGLQNIGIIEFQTEFRFDREFWLLVGAKLAGFIATILAALFLFRDYRALLAGVVAGKLILVLLTYTMHSYRPRFSFSGSRDFLHFSKWLLLNNIVIGVKNRLDTFVIGKISGAEAVGFYNLGFEISNLTSSELIWPISRVLFPGFAKMASDPLRLAQSFVASLGILVFLAAPLAIIVAATAEQLVLLFLGSQWLPVTPLIQILTLYGLLSLPYANTMALYLALGRPDLVALRNLPSLFVLPLALIWGTKVYGPSGAAWAVVLSAVLSLAVNLWLLRKETGVETLTIVAMVWRPIVAAGVVGAGLVSAGQYWSVGPNTVQLLLYLGCMGLLGAGLYVCAIFALWNLSGRPRGAEKIVLVFLCSRIMGEGSRAT